MKAPKQLDLPAAVAHAFVEDAIAYFDEPDQIEREGIAVRQLRALREHQGPREKTLRLSGKLMKASSSATRSDPMRWVGRRVAS